MIGLGIGITRQQITGGGGGGPPPPPAGSWAHANITTTLFAWEAGSGLTDDGSGKVLEIEDQQDAALKFTQPTEARRPAIGAGGGMDFGDTLFNPLHMVAPDFSAYDIWRVDMIWRLPDPAITTWPGTMSFVGAQYTPLTVSGQNDFITYAGQDPVVGDSTRNTAWLPFDTQLCGFMFGNNPIPLDVFGNRSTPVINRGMIGEVLALYVFGVPTGQARAVPDAVELSELSARAADYIANGSWPGASGSLFEPGLPQRRSVVHVLSYGQSLSVGQNAAGTAENTTPFETNIDHTGAGLAEPTQNNEPPIIEVANDFRARENARLGSASPLIMMGSSSGSGSMTALNLSPGTLQWDKLTGHLSDGVATAAGLGEPYDVNCMLYMQGESDHNAGTAPTTWKDRVDNIFAEFELEVANNGQNRRPLILMTQLASHMQYNGQRPFTAEQMLILSGHANGNRAVVAPHYWLPHGTDHIHMHAGSYRVIGALAARALHRWLIDGTPWQDFRAISHTVSGNDIDLTYALPMGGALAFDTTRITTVADQGYALYDATETTVDDVITSVTITGTNTVRVSLSRPPVAGEKLTYAWGRPGDPFETGPVTGPRGALRDTAGGVDDLTVSFGTGTETVPLHNFALIHHVEL